MANIRLNILKAAVAFHRQGLAASTTTIKDIPHHRTVLPPDQPSSILLLALLPIAVGLGVAADLEEITSARDVVATRELTSRTTSG